MIILAFETSCDDTSIAIFENEKLLFMETKSQIKIHNETGGVVPEVAAREHANVIFDVLEKVLTLSFGGKSESFGEKEQKPHPGIPSPVGEREASSPHLTSPYKGEEKPNSQFSVLNSLKQIDYIGVTTNPGLLPSLLTGTTVAGTLSTILNIPIIPINHIEAHIFSNFLDRKEEEIKFPLVCLTVSGGHNDIYLMENMWSLEKLGSSTDDAAGEAFDKAAKMMGLSYPGGPIISKLAEEYSPSTLNSFCPHPGIPSPNGRGRLQEIVPSDAELKSKENSSSATTLKNVSNYCSSPLPLGEGLGVRAEGAGGGGHLFPRVWLKKREFDFSFSGLKTSIKNEIDKRKAEKGELTLDDKRELSFEIENAITEVLAWKLVNAAKENGVKTVMLAGGVSANTKLKNEIQKLADKEGLEFIFPKKNIYSMDNAAMVGINTYYKVKYGKFEEKVGVVKV